MTQPDIEKIERQNEELNLECDKLSKWLAESAEELVEKAKITNDMHDLLIECARLRDALHGMLANRPHSSTCIAVWNVKDNTFTVTRESCICARHVKWAREVLGEWDSKTEDHTEAS